MFWPFQDLKMKTNSTLFLVLLTLMVTTAVVNGRDQEEEEEELDHSLDQDPNTVCGLQDYAKFKYQDRILTGCLFIYGFGVLLSKD